MPTAEERAAYKEKLRSIGFRRTTPGSKTTVDVHDHHTMEVTEHWNDRVDVTCKPETIHVKAPKVVEK